MTNDCKTCPVSTGTHKPAEAVHQIDEPQSEALRLAAYRFTVENLQARVAELEERLEIDYRHPYDGIAARDATIKALEERIAELEADLEAVGAGGVEPLRKRAAAQQAVQAAVPLPLLLRDIARDLGITVPEACNALKPLGNYSTNSAVTAEMARMLRKHFPTTAHPAEGVHAAVITGAIFDFAGYLTTLPHEKALHCSEAHEASPMVEAITEWCKRRGLRTDGARVETWRAALAAQAKQGEQP